MQIPGLHRTSDQVPKEIDKYMKRGLNRKTNGTLMYGRYTVQ
jgi:hypothetical protein